MQYLQAYQYTDVKRYLLLRSVLRIGQEKKSSAIQGVTFFKNLKERSRESIKRCVGLII